MPNWGEVLNEINQNRGNFLAQAAGASNQLVAQANAAQDTVRRKYLTLLQEKTRRNIIAYYSGFLSKPESLALDINDEDKNGFMTAVHQLDRDKGLDLILHTPGGRIAATQSIVNYLHKMFKGDIRAIIPQIAMSAGTMIACSCHTIVMGTHSNLGPIDPQLVARLWSPRRVQARYTGNKKRSFQACGLAANFGKILSDLHQRM
jgi:ClpP class serine protease